MSFELKMGHDGILRVHLTSDLDQMIIDRLDRDLNPFIEASTPEQPLKCMFYLQENEKVSRDLRIYLSKQIGDERIGKTAFIKPSRQFRVLAQFINKASERANITTFEHENEALRWFMNHQAEN